MFYRTIRSGLVKVSHIMKYRMRALILISLGCIFNVSMFYFTEVNLDSEVRIHTFQSLSLGSSSFLFLLMSEPFSFLVVKTLSLVGFDSPLLLQFSMYLIIVLLLKKILRERLLIFPLMVLIPSINLLAFNTQPMMISMLAAYYALAEIEQSQNYTQRYGHYFFWGLVSVGFHWMGLIFIPLILLRQKFYRSIVVTSLIVLGLLTQVDPGYFLVIIGKYEGYRSAVAVSSSVLHVYISFCLVAVFLLLIWFFRWNNHCLRRHILVYLYITSLVLLVLAAVGYKAASRIAFIIDLWIVLDFVKYWIPIRLKPGPIFFFSSRRVGG